MSDTQASHDPIPSSSSEKIDFDFQAMRARNPEKVGMLFKSDMQIRQSLRKFPPLKHIIKDGFDYEGFCHTVEQAPELTATGKALAKDIFNPNKRVGSAFMRAGQTISKQYAEMLPGSKDDIKDHPIQVAWTEVWNDTKGRYSKEVTAYEVMVAKKNEKRRKPPADTSQYPHMVPEIIHNKFKLANAAITLGSTPTLIVSDGFLQLPSEQQKAVLYHEANHGFEAVVANIEAAKYPRRRLALNGLSLNGLSRKYEYKADENAAIFGHAEPLAQALEHVTESQKPMMKEMLGSMSVVAKAAHEHGFAIDRKKAVELIGTKPTTVKQQIFAPVTHLCKSIAISSFEKGFKKFGTQSSDQLMQGAMNPKLWVFKIGTHPDIEERVTKLLGNAIKGREL